MVSATRRRGSRCRPSDCGKPRLHGCSLRPTMDLMDTMATSEKAFCVLAGVAPGVQCHAGGLAVAQVVQHVVPQLPEGAAKVDVLRGAYGLLQFGRCLFIVGQPRAPASMRRDTAVEVVTVRSSSGLNARSAPTTPFRMPLMVPT